MKKNIMLLIGNLNNGGAERSIINLANELMKYHNVILVCADKCSFDYDCNVKTIEILEFNSKHKRLKAIKKLKKIKKENNIDVTISYTTLYNYYNILSKCKDKVFISVRNHLSAKKEKFILYIYHKISLLFCDKVICCSKSVYDDQIKKYHSKKKKTVVIENFCDDALINKCIKEKIEENEKKYISNNMIIDMARLVEHKGHEHIIKSMSIVVKEKSDAKLLIFGRGNQKDYLNDLIDKYNLKNNVFLMSYYKNPFKFFKYAKCMVLASDYEGFPNVLIEAINCDLPIISTSSYGGSIEIIDDENINTFVDDIEEKKYGILVPSFINEHNKDYITLKEQLLAKAILMILNDNNKRNYYIKQSSIRKKDYSKNVIIKKWLNLINEVI